MLYFIGWVIFLLVVALAIPVASYLEKRKYAAANPPAATADDQAVFDEDAAAEGMESEDGFGQDASDEFGAGEDEVEFGEVEATGGDDFSAFDEEFK
ncbi:hypothetical protein LF1_03080 [Rubripirellula obstinata]|uniref:Uncharacterized protein n=1 Tax=Rubripirellula obstinata TaxID=406547 RepID=A0A5B1C9I6_9BACT|nr:hypothetical protein [Rubripirellula obstinata]KAA1257818.1 hypothetical protein LF1_03080 [Rubripirellula obstinata]